MTTLIDLMRGCLWVLVIVIVGAGAVLGVMYAMSPYTPLLMKIGAVIGGTLGGLIVASVITGIGFLLININDNLQKLVDQREGPPEQ